MIQENANQVRVPTRAKPHIKLVSCKTPDGAPDNFYFSNEVDPASAIEDMVWGIHTAPHNVAFWTPPEEIITASFKSAFADLFADSPKLFDSIRIQQDRFIEIAHLTGRYSSMRRKFNQLASATGGTAGDIIQEWGRISVDTIKAMADPGRKRFLTVEFQSSKGSSRALTRDTYGFHFDRRAASNFHSIFDQDQNKSPLRFCDSVRLLWVQAGPATVYIDNCDFTTTDKKALSTYRFNSEHVAGYQPPQWTFALLTSAYWPHREVLHSTPSHEKGALPERRLLWNIDVKHKRIPSYGDYLNWRSRSAQPV